MKISKQKLSSLQIAAIEATLAKGERVEIIPVKYGVKIMRVRREAVNIDPGKSHTEQRCESTRMTKK